MLFPYDFFVIFLWFFQSMIFQDFFMISIESTRNHRKMIEKSWKNHRKMIEIKENHRKKNSFFFWQRNCLPMMIWPNPVCSFYLPVSISRNPTVRIYGKTGIVILDHFRDQIPTGHTAHSRKHDLPESRIRIPNPGPGLSESVCLGQAGHPDTSM